MKTRLLSIGLVISLNALAQEDYVLIGNQHYKNEQYEQAEINFRKALEVDPQNSTAQYNLANALYKQGKYEEAARINGSLAKATQNKELKASAYYNQGVANSKNNKLEASIESYKNALKLNPSDQQARENLQKALLQQKKQKQQQDKQKQQSSNMSQKQADQKLRQLQQRERALQQKMNQKNSGGGQQQDW